MAQSIKQWAEVFGAVALLTLTAACGDVMVIFNPAEDGGMSVADAGVEVDAGEAPDAGVNTPDAGVEVDTTPPTISIDVLDVFTTATAVRINFEASEDVSFTYRLDGPSASVERNADLPGKVLTTSSFSGLTCATPYYITAWAKDKAGNRSWQVYDTFKTLPCPVVVNPPQLKISLVEGNNASPVVNGNVTIGSTRVPVLAFKLEAINEPIRITRLNISTTGSFRVGDVETLALYKNGDANPFLSANKPASTHYWDSVPGTVQPGTPVTVYAKVWIGQPGYAVLGNSLRYWVNTIVAKGAVSGIDAVVDGTAEAKATTFISPFSAVLSADYPTGSWTQAIVPGTHLARIKVANNGSNKVTMTRFTFTDAWAMSHFGNMTYSLCYSDQNSTNYSANTAQGNSGSLDFNVLANGGFTIDGGAYRYVTVVLNTLGGAVSGEMWQLSIARFGDVTYQVAEYDLGYDANGNGKLDPGLGVSLFADGKPSLATLTKQ